MSVHQSLGQPLLGRVIDQLDEVTGDGRHQPRVPASPLKGPTTRWVHQPP